MILKNVQKMRWKYTDYVADYTSRVQLLANQGLFTRNFAYFLHQTADRKNVYCMRDAEEQGFNVKSVDK